MTHLIPKVEQWFLDRQIVPNGTIQAQALKLGAETSELSIHLAENESISDDIGDILVVCIGLSMLEGYRFSDLLGGLPNYHNTDCFKTLVYYVGELQDKALKSLDISVEITNIVSQLTCIAKTRRLTLSECLAVAYEDIKDRTGTLTKEGAFVKDEK